MRRRRRCFFFFLKEGNLPLFFSASSIHYLHSSRLVRSARVLPMCYSGQKKKNAKRTATSRRNWTGFSLRSSIDQAPKGGGSSIAAPTPPPPPQPPGSIAARGRGGGGGGSWACLGGVGRAGRARGGGVTEGEREKEKRRDERYLTVEISAPRTAFFSQRGNSRLPLSSESSWLAFSALHLLHASSALAPAQPWRRAHQAQPLLWISSRC